MWQFMYQSGYLKWIWLAFINNYKIIFKISQFLTVWFKINRYKWFCKQQYLIPWWNLIQNNMILLINSSRFVSEVFLMFLIILLKSFRLNLKSLIFSTLPWFNMLSKVSKLFLPLKLKIGFVFISWTGTFSLMCFRLTRQSKQIFSPSGYFLLHSGQNLVNGNSREYALHMSSSSNSMKSGASIFRNSTPLLKNLGGCRILEINSCFSLSTIKN